MVNGTRISPEDEEEEGVFCNGPLATRAWAAEVVFCTIQTHISYMWRLLEKEKNQTELHSDFDSNR